jgi:glycosyltransferase involved in cell wall biosynthesis
VYPSRWDACPVAVLEAAAVGLPMLLGEYPLGRHFVDAGAAIGCRAETDAIAEGLGTLDAGLPAEVPERARRIARHDFAWSTVAAEWWRQLAPLVTGHSVPDVA